MTREQEILKAYNEQQTKLGNQEHTFMRGAKWADAHPRWIPVEDKLPIDSNNVLCKNARGELYVDSYVRRTMYGDIWRQGEKHPTHWMPLPVPPSCSVFPNNCEKGGEE